jgi:hypothetical protein
VRLRCTNTRIDGPEQIHLGDQLQQRRVERAGLRLDGFTATADRIRDQDIDSAPFLDNPRRYRHNRLDRLAIADIDLDP